MPFSSMPLPVQVGTKQVTSNELREQIARHTHSIAGLGAEIVQHHLAIQQKSEHLNSLVPVGRLPFEVLSDIFMLQLNMTSLGGEECQASCGEMRQYRHVHPLIPITHVCHYWRAVALQTLRLWSVITSLPQMECLEELLRRSRQLPLDVNVGHLSSAFYRIFTERHRIQSINFMSPTHWILPDVFTIPDGSSAPLLRSLVFSNAVASHSYDWTHILAHCKLPALVHLKIVACRIKWTCNVFGPNLTRLVIWNAGRTMQPTLKSTLQALELMPLLEHIELTDLLCFEQLDSEQLGAITNQVHLQYLKRLQLSDYGVACALFLEHLSFSPSTNMTLCLHSMHSKQELGNLAAPIVKKSTGTYPARIGYPWSTFSISGYEDRIVLEGHNQQYSPRQLFIKSPNARVTITIPLSRVVTISSVIEVFCRRLLLARIPTLCIGPMPYLGDRRRACMKLLIRMKTMHTLLIAGSASLKDVLDTLSDEEPADIEATSSGLLQNPPLLLPNLKTLVVNDVMFEGSNFYDSSGRARRISKYWFLEEWTKERVVSYNESAREYRIPYKGVDAAVLRHGWRRFSFIQGSHGWELVCCQA